MPLRPPFFAPPDAAISVVFWPQESTHPANSILGGLFVGVTHVVLCPQQA